MLGASLTMSLMRDRAAAECVYIQVSWSQVGRSRRYKEQKKGYAEEICLGDEVDLN